jgi:CSLREA domain-containing protein
VGFSKRQSGRFGTFAAACLIALFALGGTASAAPFTVTKTDDTNDGTCDSDCSLREAIAAANTNGEDDTITVPAGTYSIGSALNVGEASTTTTIAGANARSTVIDASGSGDRVFLFTGAAVLSHVTVSGGSNGNGGGIDASTVNLKLSDTTVKSNYAYSSGGGVLQSGGTLTVERSTFSGNQAESDGAAIDTQGGTLTVTNSTFDSNTSDANGGCVGQGAINVDSGTLNLTNDTITNNTNLLGTCSIPTGGVSFTGPTTSSVVNTIIANNTADAGSTPNCSGALTSTGHNIESGTDCGFTGTGDQQSTDPKLGALKDNGGETDTRAPNSDSPAIDAGDDTACPSTDQRGSYRPSGLQCDIGAFEVFGPLSTDPASPANENNPKVIGNAPTGWDVTLYTDSGCTSAVAGTGTAAEFASPGIAVTVDDNSTTTFYASATDPSDSSKTTGCSVASVTYVEDSIPPDPPTVSATDPASPANDNQPEVKGSDEDNSTV